MGLLCVVRGQPASTMVARRGNGKGSRSGASAPAERSPVTQRTSCRAIPYRDEIGSAPRRQFVPNRGQSNSIIASGRTAGLRRDHPQSLHDLEIAYTSARSDNAQMGMMRFGIDGYWSRSAVERQSLEAVQYGRGVCLA